MPPRRTKKHSEATQTDWTPPPLLDFFNGVHDRVVASFTGSRGASATTKGNIREAALVEIATSLPSIARIHRGDLIDSHGEHTGQLDGIVVHAASPAVALSGADRIVLAEGALGVLEVKSNLSTQWREVLDTWEKLRRLRRPLSRHGQYAKALKSLGNAANDKAATLWLHEEAIAFFVVGWKGWATHKKLQEKVRELFDAFGKGPRPQLFVGQLDIPGFAMMQPTGDNPEAQPDGKTMYWYSAPFVWATDARARGVVLLNLWQQLSERSRNASIIDIDWMGYMKSASEHGVASSSEVTQNRDSTSGGG